MGDRLVPKTDPSFAIALWEMGKSSDEHLKSSNSLSKKLWSAFASLSAPTLLLKGQYSSMLGLKTATKLATEVIPNATLQIISDAGHSLMIDNPEEFEISILVFLDKFKH